MSHPISLYYIEVRATLSGSGAFGHLGQYGHEISPTQFFICRDASAAERDAFFRKAH